MTQQASQRNWWKIMLITLVILALLLIGGCTLLVGGVALLAGSGGGGASDTPQKGIETSGNSGFKPDQTCAVNHPCDLGPGKVTVTGAESTDFINISFDKPERTEGLFVIVNFNYVSDRSEPVSQPWDEPGWVLVDSEGATHNVNYDVTSSVAIDRDLSFGSSAMDDIGPGSTTQGVVVFDVPDQSSTEFTLRLVDPVEPNVGKSAEVKISAVGG